ncbi:MAG: hypothetical protein ACTSR5_04300 [Promethearchaeota archaeon]
MFFFQVWENKILCSHCPYYAFEDEKKVKCYANYGIYKAWKYDPAPMSRSEKIQFIIGISIFAAIPLIFLLLAKNVPKNVVDDYLRHNTVMRKAWEEH